MERPVTRSEASIEQNRAFKKGTKITQDTGNINLEVARQEAHWTGPQLFQWASSMQTLCKAPRLTTNLVTVGTKVGDDQSNNQVVSFGISIMNTHEHQHINPDIEPLLAENEPITKYSARVLRRQILSDGHVSKREREFLHKVLQEGNIMDDEAYYILLDVLLNGKRLDN